MDIKTTVRGTRQVARAMDRAPREVAAEVARAIDWGTIQIANTAKQDHPYTDRTQNLTNSIGIVPARQSIGDVVGVAQAVMHYARAVEEGTPTASPHPYMRPALEKHEDEIISRIEQAAARGLRKAGL